MYNDSLSEDERAAKVAKIVESRRKRRLVQKCKASIKWQRNNRAAHYAATEQWRKNHPQKHAVIQRRKNLKLNYNITDKQWDELFEAQGKKCANCGATDPGTKKGWHVNHIKGTKIVRGIVCHHCNQMFAGAKDNIDTMLAGVEYLKKFKNLI